MQTTVIGFLGSTLDKSGKGPKRWERWRPTVSLCQHEELLINRLDLLYQKEFTGLLNTTIQDIAGVSPETKVVPHEVVIHNPWDFEEVFAVLHDFSLAYTFDQENRYLIHITTGSHVAQICLFLLTEAHYFPARLIQSGPGRGRGNASAGTYTIIDLDLSKYDQIATRFHQKYQDDLSFLKSGIATRNPGFNALIAQLEQVAARSVDPILLTGPTGAGKSRLARRIYELKKQRNQMHGSLVEVNCATLRGEQAMATLFGHTAGAFTGALKARPGLLKMADQGMLFLDEVGELGLDEQAMLLRAIENKQFLPVGADTESRSDFQLICGTNRELEQACNNGQFRDDLLARINLWTFHIPGLKDRREDIAPNFDYELERFAQRTGRRISINREARKRFLAFAIASEALWLANFRDLGAVVTRMATLAPEGRISLLQVEQEIEVLRQRWHNKAPTAQTAGLESLLGVAVVNTMDPFDRVTLEYVVQVCREVPTLAEAGRRLFACSRIKKKNVNDTDRLRKYLAKFHLDWHRIQSG